MSLPNFSTFYKVIKIVEDSLDYNDGTIDGVLEEMKRRGADIDEVMTSDLSYMVVPLLDMPRRFPVTPNNEFAPKGSKAEEYITKNKNSFKKKFGAEHFEKILYATAFYLFGIHK